MMSKLRNFLATTFLGGLVVLLPLAIFGILAKWIISLIDGFLSPFVSLFPHRWNEILIKLAAFGIITLFCFAVGLVVKTQFGTSIFSWFEEQILYKLPLYSTIKETVQQFIGKEKNAFSQVVLIKPFNENSKMLGFVTDETTDGWITVFAPTAPNPTNGYVFIVRKEDAEYIDAKTDAAMRSIISLGNGTARFIQK